MFNYRHASRVAPARQRFSGGRHASCVFLALCISFGLNAWASPASTNVDITDRAYRDIEKLVSFNLCHPPMADQRPLSRGEFARLITEARNNFKNAENSDETGDNFEKFAKTLSRKHAIKRILKRLEEEFQEEISDITQTSESPPLLRGHPLEDLRLEATLLSSTPLNIPADNGVGALSAQVNPLLHYRSGRHIVDGFQTGIETGHRFSISRHFALRVHTRFEMNTYRGSAADRAEVLLHEGYGVLQFGNASLEFGRSALAWGPGEHGGLLLTNNARPLDMIKFSTPSPFRLPWMFRHMGRWRITLFGANLGPKQIRRYAWLTGYRLSYMPVRYLELGFGNVTMMGGQDAPALSAWDVFGEFFGFRVAGTDPNSPNKTNHLMEASALVRIPQLAGLELYGVLNNEDKRDTFRRFFRDGSAYLAGFYLPRIGNTGAADFRFEFRRMSALHYRHGIFNNGYTLNNFFVGDDLGPDALGIHTRFGYDFGDLASLAAIFDWEVRRSDLHTTTPDPDGTLGDIIVDANRPDEQRYRFVIEPTIYRSNGDEIKALAGYEHVVNAGFLEGISRNNWLVALSFRLNLDRYFRFER